MNPKIHRATDLFVRGTEFVLDENEPVIIWVQKLNTFQRAEAQRDGATAQAKRLLMLSADSPEIQNMRSELAGLTKDQVVGLLLKHKQGEMLLNARRDVEADPEWNEKLLLLERWESLVADGMEQDEDEDEKMVALQEEYLKAIRDAANKRFDDLKERLTDQQREQIEEDAIETFRTERGYEDFESEYRVTELYFALRDCEAKKAEDGTWDHKKCTHKRLLDSRAEVRDLDDMIIQGAQDKLKEIDLPPDAVGKSDAPTTSSKSSEQPKPEEESTPSTPAGK